MSSFYPLRPVDGRRGSAELTASKKRALLACLAGDGALYQYRGTWRGSAGAHDFISGITVADLVRDGLLVLATDAVAAPAQLTLLGKWYAHSSARELRRGGH